jgi:glutathione S-transferase
MSDIILHHYPTSPFSEKVRLVLGYKNLSWQSVVIPMIMPKPDVLALTGGYRKTPFMQIGADIYCDSALICDVLEKMQPEPTLYPEHQKGAARIIAQWADTTLFWAAMAYNFSPAGSAQMFGIDSPQATEAIANAKMFAEDRSKMRLGMPRLPAADAAASYKSYLRRIANMLENQPFLMGKQPCIADFAVYHPLWFTRHRTSVMAGIFDATPNVLAWMDRMAAIGHATSSKLSAIDSIAISANNTPATIKNSAENSMFQDEHGIALGSIVTIASESFGPEPTKGELVAATRMHYTLRRDDDRAGTVHVHFPRIGFILKKVEK